MIKINANKIQSFIPFIKKIVEKGGPEKEDYRGLDLFMKIINDFRLKKILSDEDILILQKEFGEAFTSVKTTQGFATIKPHGYAGDFEIIDKLYQKWVSDDDNYKKWDYYTHQHPATKAVRNRKDYFKSILKSKSQGIKVLNLASGPGRDIAEFFKENPDSNIHFDCVEIDKNAIAHAKNVLKEYDVNIAQVNFIEKNIFRFMPNQKYDLIWSAGLFDYFEDRLFSKLLRRFLNFVEPNGEIIIGNFDSSNPSLGYMEFMNWKLYHRNTQDLVECALNAGVKSKEDISIESESEGVNLFMRIGGF